MTPAPQSAAALATLVALACSSSLQSVHAQRILPSESRRSRKLELEDDRDQHDGERGGGSRDLRAEVSQQTDDLVHDLPGLDPSIKITHHAGRIGLRSGARNNIFYWHFPASKSPETAPLIIWLNGGPGCSSMQGLFLGVSPFKLVNGTHIELNPHSWHHSANVLFVDQPVGTGMSFSRGNSYRSDEAGVAADFYDFLTKFLLSHTEYLAIDPANNKQRSRELFLFGESHAGRYIPQFAAHILEQNAAAFKDADITIELRGAGIGNGWVHPPIQYEYSDYAHGIGLITFGQVRSLQREFGACADALRAGQFNTAPCFSNMNAILHGAKSASGKALNFYDVREYVRSVSAYPSGQEFMVEYLNQLSVRKALHANEESAFKFAICSDPVYDALRSFDGVSSLVDVEHMLRSGVRVLFYNGQWDMMCNHYGTEKLLLHLDWDGASAYQSATKYTWATRGRSEPAGYAQQGGNLTYLVVANGGHMVPYDVPDVAADMMHKFVHGVAFTDTAQQLATTRMNGTDLDTVQCAADASVPATSGFVAAVQQLGLPWIYVAVLISVVSSVLAVAVTLLFLRTKKAKRSTSTHSRIVQESDDDDDDDDDSGDEQQHNRGDGGNEEGDGGNNRRKGAAVVTEV